MQLESIEVSTRDEYKGAQEPVSFVWRGEEHHIAQVVDRWYEGGIDPTRMPMTYFRVKTRMGETFLIRYHEFFRAWGMVA